MPTLSAADVIRMLDLEPHPEGGHYRQTVPRQPHRPRRTPGARRAIYFLLRAANARTGTASMRSRSGTTMQVRPSGSRSQCMSGGRSSGSRWAPISPSASGRRRSVPVHAWQAATTLGDWTLVGCTVAPGFEWARLRDRPEGLGARRPS